MQVRTRWNTFCLKHFWLTFILAVIAMNCIASTLLHICSCQTCQWRSLQRKNGRWLLLRFCSCGIFSLGEVVTPARLYSLFYSFNRCMYNCTSYIQCTLLDIFIFFWSGLSPICSLNLQMSTFMFYFRITEWDIILWPHYSRKINSCFQTKRSLWISISDNVWNIGR